MAQAFTDASFEADVKKSNQLTFVDFWAPWCGPCRMTGPFVDELAVELEGKVKIGKVNVDENPNVAGEFNILSIPSFLLFKDGQVIDQVVGGVQKERLLEMINKHL